MCIGNSMYNPEMPAPKMKGKFLAGDIYSFVDVTEQGNYLDYKYYMEHKDKFEKLYDKLADEKSRKVLEAYINQRVSGRFGYLQGLWDKELYFDSEIVDFARINTFVDCGAYNGDTYRDFLKAYRERTGKNYHGQAYLWEPEAENLKELYRCYDGDEKVNIIAKGAWHTVERLHFSGGGKSGGVAKEKSERVIQADTIDNVIKGAVDFIKMDIEGAEY